MSKKLNVLIVEDDVPIRNMLERIVVNRGHDVLCVDNAEIAWVEIQKNERCYSLILLDWMLSGQMSGVDLCNKIRCSQFSKFITILMITGKTDTKDQEKAINSGVDDYLVKPFGVSLANLRISVAENICNNKLDHIDAEDRNEKVLMQITQMAGVGKFASGIAHEFNNINSVIRGHIESILIKNDLRENVKEQLEIALKMVRRSVNITRSLTVFSKEKAAEKSIISLSDIAKDVVEFVNEELSKDNIIVESNIDSSVKAYLNEAYITQVFINLIINAKHALIDTKNKKIIITVGKKDSNVFFSIEDNGCGISSEDIGSLFNPFFSTKGEHAHPGSPLSNVKGTGLGLSICHTIVTKHHDGWFDVESEIGKGSKFTVWLKVPDLKKNESGEVELSLISGNKERIMILDDDSDIVEYIVRVLSDVGYCSVGFVDCNEALQAHEDNPFDVIIVDINMPIMNGIDFIRNINKMNNLPGKIIMTGRNINSNDNEIKELCIDDFILKPFSFKNLFTSLRKALNRG